MKLGGGDKQLIRMIVGGFSVGKSYLWVARAFVKPRRRQFWAMPRGVRREVLAEVWKVHTRNRKEYGDVMGGRIR